LFVELHTRLFRGGGDANVFLKLLRNSLLRNFGITNRGTPRRKFFRGKTAPASGDKFEGSFLEPFEFGLLG